MIPKLVSVIVPVYNTEQFLERCVQSILKQTYQKLEILLIDDGSTDGSGETCDRFALQDERIHVIHQKNGGLSAARNTGMQKASGEYLTFVDSDDWIHPQMVETLLFGIEKENADLSMGYIKNTDTFNEIATELKPTRYSVKNREEYWYMGYEKAPTGRQLIMCPAKLYRSSLLKGLSFLQGVLHEDVFWVSAYAPRVQKAVVYSDSVYFYYQRPGSIIHTTKPKEIWDQLDACLYKMKIGIREFPLQAQEGRNKFLEYFFITAYRSRSLEKKKQNIVRKWLLKNHRDVLRSLRPSLNRGQKQTFFLLPIIPNCLFLKLLDYRLDFKAFLKSHLCKQGNGK